MNSPIMCVGMPRSGTTWIAKIIDSHPQIYYNHEPDSVYSGMLNGINLLAEHVSLPQKEAIKLLVSGLPYTHEKCIGKRPFFKKDYRPYIAEKYFQLSVLMTKVFNFNLLPSQSLYKDRQDVRLMFKSIESTGRVKAFLEAVDDLKITLIIRSVFGHINSVINGINKGKFTVNEMPLINDDELAQCYEVHGSKNIHDLAMVLQYTPIERLAYRWLVFNEKALYEAEAYAERVYVLSYDKLCDQPEQGAKQLFEFFELDFAPQSRAFIHSSTQKQNNAYYSLSKNPQKAKASWQKRFSNEQIELINNVIRGSKAEQVMQGD